MSFGRSTWHWVDNIFTAKMNRKTSQFHSFAICRLPWPSPGNKMLVFSGKDWLRIQTVNKHREIFSIPTKSVVLIFSYLFYEIQNVFWSLPAKLEFSDMTNAIMNQHCTEPGQAQPVSTAHPALKRYVCLPSVVIWAPADTTQRFIHIHWLELVRPSSMLKNRWRWLYVHAVNQKVQ